MIIPNMGKARRRTGLADALFTPVQQRVLGLLFGQPARQFQASELIRLANSGSGAVQRQIARLSAAGLVTVARSGNQKHYQARRESPIFNELHGLVVKTVAVVEPLGHALKRAAPQIRAAFVYGSVAKGQDKAGSDIDLMVVSDRLNHADLYTALDGVERVLGRHVNPTVLTSAEFKTKRAKTDSFVARIISQPRLFVIGTADELD